MSFWIHNNFPLIITCSLTLCIVWCNICLPLILFALSMKRHHKMYIYHWTYHGFRLLWRLIHWKLFYDTLFANVSEANFSRVSQVMLLTFILDGISHHRTNLTNRIYKLKCIITSTLFSYVNFIHSLLLKHNLMYLVQWTE